LHGLNFPKETNQETTKSGKISDAPSDTCLFAERTNPPWRATPGKGGSLACHAEADEGGSRACRAVALAKADHCMFCACSAVSPHHISASSWSRFDSPWKIDISFRSQQTATAGCWNAGENKVKSLDPTPFFPVQLLFLNCRESAQPSARKNRAAGASEIDRKAYVAAGGCVGNMRISSSRFRLDLDFQSA
jgi:hypothetical protein